MKIMLNAAVLLFMPLTSHAAAQASPTVVAPSSVGGFHLPTVGGTLSYSVSASQGVNLGYSGGDRTQVYTNLSGDLALLTRSERRPFSLIYSGGFFGDDSSDGTSSIFQNLALSQVLIEGKWTFVGSDSVSYLPQTSSIGLSGLPGVGDAGSPPVQVGANSGFGILTSVGPRVTNTAVGSVQRNLSGSTFLSGSATYSLLRFTNNDLSQGANNDQYIGSLNLTHRIDARTSLGGNYSYATFSYPNEGEPLLLGQPSVTTNTFSFQYSRLLSRKLSTSVSVGPQWTTLESSGTTLNVSANAQMSYMGRKSAASVSYARGTNAGSGVLNGAQSDTLQGAFNRRLGRSLSASASVAYNRSNSIEGAYMNGFNSRGIVVGGQISKGIGRRLSSFASYNVEKQTDQGTTATGNAFSGLSQIMSIGITYSPGLISLGHR